MSRSFSPRLCLLAIDELHLVSEWKDFRPQYNELRVLRSRISAEVPVLGVSATLDAYTLDWVQASVGFENDVRIMRSSIDRPEIYFQISCIQETETSMLDLQCLLPKTTACFLDLPKTIIYMDSIAQISKALELFRTWMRQLQYPTESPTWIAPYFSDMADSDKERVDTNFRRRHEGCASPRIILATDAYGLGVDNPDVDIVVQWLLPPSIQRLYQRMGRAMRCGQKKATFILMHQSWCLGERSKQPVQRIKNQPSRVSSATEPQVVDPDLSDSSTLNCTQPLPQTRTASDRRRDMSAGLYEIINADPSQCIRIVGLQFFDDITYSQTVDKPKPCCSNCDPASRYDTTPHPKLKPQGTADPLRRPWFRKALSDWRSAVAAAVSEECGFAAPASLVMPDQYMDLLTRWASDIRDRDSMLRFAGPWSEMATYCAEVLEILHEGREMSVDDSNSPAFRLWVAENDSTRRHKFALPQAPTSKSGADLREERRNAWLLQKGLRPVNPRSQKKGRRGESPTALPADLTPRRAKTVQRNLAQSACHESSEGGAERGSLPAALPKKRRQPLVEVQPRELQTQEPLADSSFGRKRKRPAHFDSQA